MKKYLLLILATVVSCLAYAQDAEALNEQSNELIEQEKFKEAYPILLKAAELDHAEAQYNLGYLFYSGLLGERNMAEGITWFKKSSDNGFIDGHFVMMRLYEEGQGVEQNLALSLNYALKGAENNHVTCMRNVVHSYLNGLGTEADTLKAVEWLFKLAKLPNPENVAQSGLITSARLRLASSYLYGDYSLEKDLYQSYLWYLIYNENKSDLTAMEQEGAMRDIKTVEKELTKTQLARAPADAEKLLGRKLNARGAGN